MGVRQCSGPPAKECAEEQAEARQRWGAARHATGSHQRCRAATCLGQVLAPARRSADDSPLHSKQRPSAACHCTGDPRALSHLRRLHQYNRQAQRLRRTQAFHTLCAGAVGLAYMAAVPFLRKHLATGLAARETLTSCKHEQDMHPCAQQLSSGPGEPVRSQ